MRLKLTLAALAAGAALATAAPAAATTFCVPTFHPACPNNGTNVEQGNLETALGMNATDGVADTVLIAPGTYTDPDSWEPTGSDPLTIRGNGPAGTVLTSSSTMNRFVVDLSTFNSRVISMEDLTIQIPASFPDNGGNGAGVQMRGDTLDNVDIISRNTGGTDAIASVLDDGAFRDGEIRGEAGGSVATAIRVSSNADQMTVENAAIDADYGISLTAQGNAGPSEPLIARRVTIRSDVTAIDVNAGTANVENAVLLPAPNQVALAAFANSDANAILNADHVTAVSAGGNAPALFAGVQSGDVGNAEINVSNSILREFAAAYVRNAPAGVGGDADLTISYSNFALGAPTNSGDGSATLAPGNIDADPLFVSPTNLALKAGSPSIDKGSPSPTPIVDFLGAPRPVNGDAVPGAVRDQGAYEYQPPIVQPPQDTAPPQTTITAKPRKKLKKRKATFAFSSNEANSTFRCKLDAKPERACTSPVSFKRLKRGKHLFTVYATDKAGNADATPATHSFKVTIKKKKRK